MICLICRQADVVDGWTTVHLERGEMGLVVKNVPAQICPNCGDAYVSEEMAVQLLQYAERMAEDGVLEGGVDFQDML